MVTPAQYFKEVVQETQKVTWPSRQQTLTMTALVVFASLAVGIYIGALDFLFERLLGFIL
jgi:preprotein translocase subunit SecE